MKGLQNAYTFSSLSKDKTRRAKCPFLIHVDNVNWSVAQFEHDQLGEFFPVPWTFQKNGTFEATNQRKGKWVQQGVDQEHRIHVEIKNTANQIDKFYVRFLTQNRFVAYKQDLGRYVLGEIYRYGRKLIIPTSCAFQFK